MNVDCDRCEGAFPIGAGHLELTTTAVPAGDEFRTLVLCPTCTGDFGEWCA